MAPIYSQPPLPNSDSAFPILSIAIFSIVGTAFLLISYYIFVIRCCLNWQQFYFLRQFSTWLARRDDDPFIAFSPTMWNHGLDESIIRELPTSMFKRREGDEGGMFNCVVCLNQFQEQDMLRVLPNCNHEFHLDCIDIWFQTNGNCPLCRTSISGSMRQLTDQIVAPNSSPQHSDPFGDGLMGGNEDFVVIELGGEHEQVFLPGRQQESESSRDVLRQQQPRNHSPKKKVKNWKLRSCYHVSIMGDEEIDVREKDDQFLLQPIRRSFSLDSATDRQLYLTVQAVIKQNRYQSSGNEGNQRLQSSFVTLRHGQGSRIVNP